MERITTLIVSGKEADNPASFRYDFSTPLENVNSMELVFASVPFTRFIVNENNTKLEYLVAIENEMRSGSVYAGRIVYGSNVASALSVGDKVIASLGNSKVLLTVSSTGIDPTTSNTFVEFSEKITDYEGEISFVYGRAWIIKGYVDNANNPDPTYIAAQLQEKMSIDTVNQGANTFFSITVAADNNQETLNFTVTSATATTLIHGPWNPNLKLGIDATRNDFVGSGTKWIAYHPVRLETDPYLYLYIRNLPSQIEGNVSDEGHRAFSILWNDKSKEIQLKNSCLNIHCFDQCVSRLNKLEIEIRDSDGNLYDFNGSYPVLGFRCSWGMPVKHK